LINLLVSNLFSIDLYNIYIYIYIQLDDYKLEFVAFCSNKISIYIYIVSLAFN